MQTKDLQKQQEQKQDSFDDKMRTWLIYYVDLVARGLIALIIMLCIIFIIRYIFPNIPNFYFLPMAFIISLIITPFLSKIKIGHLFVDRYMQLLNNIVYKFNRSTYS
jgi:hypothetical protein